MFPRLRLMVFPNAGVKRMQRVAVCYLIVHHKGIQNPILAGIVTDVCVHMTVAMPTIGVTNAAYV